MNEEKEIIINGIDVSKYFIEVVDEGGSTINYKILPNIERLLVERIFEQNQQVARLQEENEKQKKQIKDLQVRKDKYYLKNLEYEKEISYLIQALEEIREIAKYSIMHNSELNLNYQIILQKIDEALNDRD